ncbi:MAG: hypothetical protein KKA73_07875 [Chloroflexi bacterium]|nr:hypothetical protein [Chloroflexota bacterium]
MGIRFYRADDAASKDAINAFLTRHTQCPVDNQRGAGSTRGYVAYYATAWPDDGRPLLDRLVAVAKFCPLHTPQAARFFAGGDWRHVYTLQRLAACRAPANLLSQFLSWCLREMGRDERCWYVATYTCTSTYGPDGLPHDGGIYRATNAVYGGLTASGRVEGFLREGRRHSMRCGPKTHTVAELTAINEAARQAGRQDPIRPLRGAPKHRYCWAVGPNRWVRRQCQRALEQRLARYQFVPAS